MMSIINYIDDHLGPFHLQGVTLFCMIRSSYTVLCINIINIIIIFLLMMMLCVTVITYNNYHHLCPHCDDKRQEQQPAHKGGIHSEGSQTMGRAGRPCT